MAPSHAGGVVARIQGDRIEYLVVEASDSPGRWVFPKGHIEPGEDAAGAALREVREEAGIEAEIIQELGRQQYAKPTETADVRYFLMRYRNTVLASEPRRVAWYPGGEARHRLSFRDAQETLDTAMRIIAQMGGLS